MSDNPVWDKQRNALNKIQVNFEFTERTNNDLRHEAVERKTNPSDLVRSIVGLSSKDMVRQRVGLSLSDEDFAYLAKRYGLAIEDKKSIREKMRFEVESKYRQERQARLHENGDHG